MTKTKFEQTASIANGSMAVNEAERRYDKLNKDFLNAKNHLDKQISELYDANHKIDKLIKEVGYKQEKQAVTIKCVCILAVLLLTSVAGLICWLHM